MFDLKECQIPTASEATIWRSEHQNSKSAPIVLFGRRPPNVMMFFASQSSVNFIF